MNDKLTELYRSCRPKEALASQDEFKSANVLLGSEVETFAKVLIEESIKVMMENDYHGEWLGEKLKEHFGVTK